MPIIPPYELTNEYNITQLLEHFDSNYIFDLINDKIENIDYSSVLTEPNIIVSFEENFKMMAEMYPGDSQNIQSIKLGVYTDVINILCEKFNLDFNQDDDNINRHTLAYYLYDFLVCNRKNYLILFFVRFIMNNKDSLCTFLNLDDYKKGKDTASIYNKHIYSDYKYGLISANMYKVLEHIATLDVTLYNIFQNIYFDQEVLYFLDTSIGDKGNFFNDFYCSVLQQPDIIPVVITNTRLMLQATVGDLSKTHIAELINMTNGGISNE